VADPDLALPKLGMLEAEAEELLGAARGPGVELPQTCVHELVDAQAGACGPRGWDPSVSWRCSFPAAPSSRQPCSGS